MKKLTVLTIIAFLATACGGDGGGSGGGGGSTIPGPPPAVTGGAAAPTTPTAALTAGATTVLLDHFDNNTNDATGRHAVNFDNTVDDAVNSKFGGHSRKFTAASSQYLDYLNSGDWDFQNNDFAIEFWLRAPVNNQVMYLLAQCNNTCASASITVAIDLNSAVNGQLRFIIKSNVTNKAIVSIGSVADGQWHYIKADKVAGDAHLYIDGALQGTQPGLLAIPASLDNLTVGRAGGAAAAYFTGNIDDLRINKN